MTSFADTPAKLRGYRPVKSEWRKNKAELSLPYVLRMMLLLLFPMQKLEMKRASIKRILARNNKFKLVQK